MSLCATMGVSNYDQYFCISVFGRVYMPCIQSITQIKCGEWDDGCGRTIICGMCSKGRTGLPATWRVKCVEGQCIDYCPPWDKQGYWFLSNENNNEKTASQSATLKKVLGKLNKDLSHQQFLSPADAVEICEVACNMAKRQKPPAVQPDTKKHNTTTFPLIPEEFRYFLEPNNNPPLCRCGTTKSKILSKNLTLEDFSKAHDVKESCKTNKARKEGIIETSSETQPICCPELRLPPKSPLPTGWKRLFSMGKDNLEGEYFHNESMECGTFPECEELGRKMGAELAVYDMYNSMCYLARNVVDLGNWFTLTKDNHNRFAIDLRGR